MLSTYGTRIWLFDYVSNELFSSMFNYTVVLLSAKLFILQGNKEHLDMKSNKEETVSEDDDAFDYFSSEATTDEWMNHMAACIELVKQCFQKEKWT